MSDPTPDQSPENPTTPEVPPQAPAAPQPPQAPVAPQQPAYGAPQPPAYGAPQPPQYGAPQPPAYGAPASQPAYGAPAGQPAYAAQPPQQYGAPVYGAPPQYGAAAYGYSAEPKTNSLAIVSLVSSLVGVFVIPIIGQIVGIITGHMSLSQIKKNGERGRGLAMAGTIIGYVSLGLAILGIILFVALVVPLMIANSGRYGYSS